ncbi:MAG: TRAP transporter substrate-binding protein DctP [Alphaproteobacteria bacterium]
MATTFASIITAAAAIGILAMPVAPSAAQTVNWDLALYGKPRAITAGAEMLSEYVKQKSNGEFTLTIHWGTLAQPREFLDGISLNAFQGAYYAASFSPGKTPIATVLDLPFLPIDTYEQSVRVFDAFRAYKPGIDEMKRWNAVNFMSMNIESYEIMGKGAPPRSFLDLSGLRLRAIAGFGDIVKAMGGQPVTIVPPELYGAMERGMVDGAAFPLSNFGPYRLQEIAKWYTVGMPTTSAHSAIIFNDRAFADLPAPYKKLLDDGRAVGYAAQKVAYNTEREKSVADYKKAGLTEIRISAVDRQTMMEKAAKPIWDAWIAETSAKGIDARGLLDYILAEARRVL